MSRPDNLDDQLRAAAALLDCVAENCARWPGWAGFDPVEQPALILNNAMRRLISASGDRAAEAGLDDDFIMATVQFTATVTGEMLRGFPAADRVLALKLAITSLAAAAGVRAEPVGVDTVTPLSSKEMSH